MAPPASPLSAQFAHRTDEGARGKHNDDAFDYFIGFHDEHDDVYFLTVADGVTSNAGGDQASDIAISAIRNQLKHLSNAPILEQITDAVHYAHRKILKIAQKSPDYRNMSTTIVLAAVAQGKLHIAHLGDSRAYLIRDEQIHLLTIDHTWVQDAIDQGRLSAKEAKSHPNRHVIKRFLGIQERISIDYSIVLPSESRRPKTERSLVQHISLQPDDLVLLCTDGLTNRVGDDEICSIVSKVGQPLQQAIDELTDLALSRDEGDNITSVLMQVVDTTVSPNRSKSRVKKPGLLILLTIAIFVSGIATYTVLQTDIVIPDWLVQFLPLFQVITTEANTFLCNVQP